MFKIIIEQNKPKASSKDDNNKVQKSMKQSNEKRQRESVKQKAGFLEKINKIDELQVNRKKKKGQLPVSGMKEGISLKTL